MTSLDGGGADESREEISLDDPELEWRVMRLGQEGLTRAQIALRLGLTLEEIKAREGADPAFGKAMRAASEARVDWYHEQMRQRLVEQFDLTLYIAEFRWRFPGEPLPWEADPPPAPPEPERRWRRGGLWRTW